MTTYDERTGRKSGGSNLQGLDRALTIIARVSEEPVSAKRLADELGIKWPTAHRTLSELRAHGCLTRDDSTGLYHIGPSLYFMGSSYLTSLPVFHAARGPLRIAADHMGCTAQVVSAYQRRTMNLLVVESSNEVVPRSTIDFHFPLHCGSKGLVLLAFAGADAIDDYLAQPLEALTRHTMTDPNRLRKRLREIREQEYAVTHGDVQLTSSSVAAPVRNASGDVIASVTLITQYNGFGTREDMAIDVVMTAARSIAIQLGWRPM